MGHFYSWHKSWIPYDYIFINKSPICTLLHKENTFQLSNGYWFKWYEILFLNCFPFFMRSFGVLVILLSPSSCVLFLVFVLLFCTITFPFWPLQMIIILLFCAPNRFLSFMYAHCSEYQFYLTFQKASGEYYWQDIGTLHIVENQP